jgi:two-component system, cell cycle sensor histidine kinase and response regulator CckA
MSEEFRALTSLDILIVEDSADDATLLLAELKSAGFDPHWKQVETEANYLANLRPQLDIIFSDFSLPQFSTIRALALLQERKLDIPFVIVSGTIGEERAVESMKAGATDYVLKDSIHRLGPVVRRALREAKERAENKRLEAQFIEAQKMEVVGHLASGVAHDFNNILGVVIGYGDLMMLGLDAENPLRKYAEEIRHAAERAVGLTRQLLLFSRKQSLQLVVLDLNEVIKGMDKMLRRLTDENIQMVINPGEQIGHVKADSGQVGQVLMNLVVNARDAMPNGGKLTIQTRNVTLGGTATRAHADAISGEYVLLSVVDTGMGMTDEVKAHLFEAFFTTKPAGKGTGLGLMTCRTILKQCGGYINVQSELGKGSTFEIFFPRIEQPLHASTQPVQATALPRGTETLLLIEDDPSVRHLASNILEEQGYIVLHAYNGAEGLRVAHESKGEPIRLVITDVVMPEMRGKIMAEWLTTTYPNIKILFTSGYTDETIEQYCVLKPGVALLPKPYTPAALTRKVRELLDENVKSEIKAQELVDQGVVLPTRK